MLKNLSQREIFGQMFGQPILPDREFANIWKLNGKNKDFFMKSVSAFGIYLDID